MMFFIYSVVCFCSSFLFLKDIKQKKLLGIEKKKLFFFILILFYSNLWNFFDFSLVFLFISSLPPFGFLILIPYLERRNQTKLLNTLQDLLIPVKSQMKQGSCFMESWDESVKDLAEGEIKSSILAFCEVLRFQKCFSHPSSDVRFFIQHLMEIRKSSQSLDRLLELENKLKTEKEFLRKSSQTLLQLRWQSFILTGIYLFVFAFALTYYRFSYPKLMLGSFICFVIGLFWLFRIGRRMKWSV